MIWKDSIKLAKVGITRGLLGIVSAIVICLLPFLGTTRLAAALSSTNYQFSETQVGGLGSPNGASTNYQAQTSGGIAGFENSASAGFQINAGNTTTADPGLAFGIVGGTAALSSFSAAVPATATATFQVANYTSYGYVVQVAGNPPSNGAHSITAMATTNPSQVGTEQFGINLVANTSPSNFGANPDHGQFGFGSASSNYGTSNNYRYVSGETIATGPKTSGMTLYTISYIVNVTNLTPGGNYTADQTIICTGMY